MKLYIPTCTLNFNNILTTESISPYSFYEKRGFGDKRFYKVEANSLDNNVIFYSKCPIFTVDNSEMENYPMVIEIETNDYKNDKFVEISEQDGVKIYFSNSTIYLNHYNCFIYFQNNEEQKICLVKSEQSSEIKYRELYKENLRVTEKKENTFEWQKSFIETIKDTEFNNKSLEEDKFIDKLKGVIVCYLVGENSYSTNKEIAILKSRENKVKAILDSIYNSKRKEPDKTQRENLNNFIKEINSIINFNDIIPETKKNTDFIKSLEFPNKDEDKKIHQIAYRIYKFIDEFKQGIKISFDAEDELRSLLKIWSGRSQKKEEEYKNFLNHLSSKIEQIVKYEKQNRTQKFIEEIFSIQEGNLILNSRTDYYVSLLNILIRGEYETEDDKGKSLSKPLGIAVSGAKKLREFYNNTKKPEESSWEDSDYRQYAQSLIYYFTKNLGFDILKTNHPVLIALAAFCIKYIEPYRIDRLIKYMQEIGFSDYEFALGLYGADKGFADLPKTFTNYLINNSSYYDRFFKELHKLLFGYTISKSSDIEEKKVITSSTNEEKSLNYLNPILFMDWLIRLRGIKNEAYRKLNEKKFQETKNKFYSDKSFLQEIYSIIGEDNKGKYEEDIKEAFEGMKTGKEPNNELNNYTELKSNKLSNKSIIESKDWIVGCIDNLHCDDEKKEQISRDIWDFIENHKEQFMSSETGEPEVGKYYEEYIKDKSNQKTLDRLKNFLDEEGHSEFIEKILDYLRKQYVI